MNKEELLKLMNSSETQLDSLKQIDYEGLRVKTVELESAFKEFKEAGNELLSQNDTLQIGIVGQVKAGKSSFLNSLFFDGKDILPRASTPMTAGLTVIEYSDSNTFEVEYFNDKDWNIFVKQNKDYETIKAEVEAKNEGAPEIVIKMEIDNRTSDRLRSAHEMVESCSSEARSKIGQKNDVQPFDSIDELKDVLEKYVGASGKFTSVVKSLYVKMNDERLRGLRIVDTPGVNDPVVSRENRTRMFLHSCHGVFLLSSSGAFLDNVDISFLNSRIGGSGIKTVVLLASKFDSVLENLGAEKDMKKEPCLDLVDAIEMIKRKFKRRLRDLSDTIDDNLRGKIKLDTTAGIGFSIARKDKSQWDSIESNIVNRMQHFYPNYFATDEDIKETFEGLANIADIRQNYLDGTFMKNKETIISERINSFFDKQGKEIGDSVAKILDEYKDRKKQLEETTTEEIKKQKEQQGRMFENLKSEFSNVFSSFNNSLQASVFNMANRIRFKAIDIPTEQTTGSIVHQGKVWGHNHTDMEYEQINEYQLKDLMREGIENYGDGWNEEWKKLFGQAKVDMSEKLYKAISEFELEIMSTAFNDTYYRHLVDKSLDDLNLHLEIKEVGENIDKYQRMSRDIAEEQYVPSGTQELKRSEVSEHLRQQFKKHKRNVQQQLDDIIDGLKHDIKTSVEKNLKSAIAITEDMKTSFADKLQKEGEAYLEQMEKDMQSKMEVLQKMDSIIATLTALNNLYNK